MNDPLIQTIVYGILLTVAGAVIMTIVMSAPGLLILAFVVIVLVCKVLEDKTNAEARENMKKRY
jgi:hypothetical protein